MQEIRRQDQRTRGETIAFLRQQISDLEGYKGRADAGTACFGLPEVDQALPGGLLATGAVHEVISQGDEDAAAAGGFVAGILGRLIGDKGMIVWIMKGTSIFPHGLLPFGLRPERIIFISLYREKESLWALEEALRCQGLAAVVGEVPDASLTATRRMQLAVERSGSIGFLLRHNPRQAAPSSCMTSWRIRSAPSVLDDDLPGVGFPRWHVELQKARSGRPGQWTIEWKGGRFVLVGEQARVAENVPAYRRAV